jgi:hypothetical protein
MNDENTFLLVGFAAAIRMPVHYRMLVNETPGLGRAA